MHFLVRLTPSLPYSTAADRKRLGVLQNEAVSFQPEFPEWKQDGIDNFDMGTYTKIFLQFPSDKVFWPKDTQYFLYADPVERGYYPVFQSLDSPGFLEGSGIIFVTVVHDQAYRVEAQTDDETKDQVMAVLRDMFGADKVPDRVVPPAPGKMPTLISGRPILALGLSAAMMRWQASGIS